MQELGELLRQKREELGVSLKDVQAETKIRIRYLEALEAGDESAFPGEVYLKGFLRSYGDYLGLDGWELVGRYRDYRTGLQPATRGVKKNKPAPSPPAPVRLGGGRGRLWSVAFVLVLLVVLAFLIGGRWLLPTGPDGVEQPPPAVEPAPAPAPAPEPVPSPAPGPVEEPPQEVTIDLTVDRESEALYEVIAPELTVGIEARANCWIRVEVDGNFVAEETLRPGDTRSWTGDRIWIRFGNPDGVDLEINGVDVGPAGTHRAPRNVTVELRPRV